MFVSKRADPVTDGVALDELYAGNDEGAKPVVAEFSCGSAGSSRRDGD